MDDVAAKVPPETAASCTPRTATLEPAVQTVLAIPGTSSRNVAVDVTPLRTFRTSKKGVENNCSGTEATERRQHRGDGTQLAMHPKPLSLSLSLSDRPSHESRNGGLNALYSVSSTGGSAAGRSATLHPSAQYVSACAVSSTRSSSALQSSDSMRAALSVCRRRYHQITQQLVPSPPSLP